jgi:hypothetical protein
MSVTHLDPELSVLTNKHRRSIEAILGTSCILKV